MLNSNGTPSVTYFTPSGMRITICNPRDCYLTWANGEVIRPDCGMMGHCTTGTEANVVDETNRNL